MNLRRILLLAAIFCGMAGQSQPALGQIRVDSLRPFSLIPVNGEVARAYFSGATGVSFRFAGESRLRLEDGGFGEDEELPLLVSGQLGFMQNLNRRHALGVGMYFGVSGDSWRLGMGPRYTYWFTRTARFDLEPVLLLAGDNSTSDVSYPAFGVGADFAVLSWLSLDARVEVIEHTCNALYEGSPIGLEWTETSWYGGVRLGDYPGLFIAAAAAVAYGLASLGASSL